MGSLPDELWIEILQSGIKNGQLHHRDLCAMATVSTRFFCISCSDSVWKQLTLRKFTELDTKPIRESYSRYTWQDVYKLSFEKVKQIRIAANQRRMIRLRKAIQNLERLLPAGRRDIFHPGKNCASQTLVALQLWQPYVVSTRHEQVVQQLPVDLQIQKQKLSMMLQLNKAHIHCIENTLKSHEAKVEVGQKELEDLKYNPTQDLTGCRPVLVQDVHGKKRKSTEGLIHPVANSKSLFTSTCKK